MTLSMPLQNFTNASLMALKTAHIKATRGECIYVGSLHLLLGIITDKSVINVFKNLGVDVSKIRLEVLEILDG